MALCRACACQRVGNESEDLVQMHTCTFLPTCGSNAHTNACKHPKCAHTQTFHCPQSTVGAARRGVAASRGQESKAAEAEAKAKRQTRPAHRMQRARKPRLRTHTPSHDPHVHRRAHTFFCTYARHFCCLRYAASAPAALMAPLCRVGPCQSHSSKPCCRRVLACLPLPLVSFRRVFRRIPPYFAGVFAVKPVHIAHCVPVK